MGQIQMSFADILPYRVGLRCLDHFINDMYSDDHKWWAKQNLVTFFVN